MENGMDNLEADVRRLNRVAAVVTEEFDETAAKFVAEQLGTVLLADDAVGEVAAMGFGQRLAALRKGIADLVDLKDQVAAQVGWVAIVAEGVLAGMNQLVVDAEFKSLTAGLDVGGEVGAA